MTPALAFDRVACVRGGRMLFEGVDFAVAGGGAVVARGANGAGKSSLIRIAAGLLAAAAGAVTRTGSVALLAEAAALDAEAPLAGALGFWARVDRVPMAAVEAALAAVGLAALADAPVGILSTGQRRRAGMARVLASGAAIWLLDEPTSGLDGDSIAGVEALVAAHRAAGGIALVATHQPLAMPGAVEVLL